MVWDTCTIFKLSERSHFLETDTQSRKAKARGDYDVTMIESMKKQEVMNTYYWIFQSSRTRRLAKHSQEFCCIRRQR